MENLKEVLIRHGFSFKKCFGQNFISDANLLKSIVTLADIDNNSTVVEIGAGGGTLTREIAAIAKNVISFEIDFKLKPVLKDMTADFNNIEFIFSDFLKYNLEELEDKAGENYTVIANLPYYITTPIIMRFIEKAKKFKCLIIMVQEEVALRLTAKENTPDYGAITAAIDICADAEIVKKVHRSIFYPIPNVDSAIVKITANNNKYDYLDLKTYKDTVKYAFLNRRKTLVNNLILNYNFTREQSENLLNSVNIDLKARGETLSTSMFVQLSNKIYKKLNEIQ
jgi:16S rRNA (adenine1518-N6/adenine1519-N6)-dimethyltransferase